MKATTASCFFLLLLPLVSNAERVDALKPVNVVFGQLDVDNITGVVTATGDVTVTRGTMVLKSDKAEVREASNGDRTFVLIATSGKLATFRVKRDGGANLWLEGHAQRIEYDDRADIVKLFSKAMVRQLEGNKTTHQIEQAFLSYNNTTGVVLGRNDPTGANLSSNGRGTLILEPRRTSPGISAHPPAEKQ